MHSRHYTVEQATALQGWVIRRVRCVRHARTMLGLLGPRAAAAVQELDERSGGSYPGPEVARPLAELSRAMAELDAIGIVLRDVNRGLIDFPAIRPDGSGRLHDCGGEECPARGTPDGDEIYLCWLVDDEEEIGFWHPVETGFGGREPLP